MKSSSVSECCNAGLEINYDFDRTKDFICSNCDNPCDPKLPPQSGKTPNEEMLELSERLAKNHAKLANPLDSGKEWEPWIDIGMNSWLSQDAKGNDFMNNEDIKNCKQHLSETYRSLLHSSREDVGKNWYFEGDELVITKGKWVIDRYKKHTKETL